MNIYLHELKSLLKTTIIWTLSIIALAALYLGMYPSIAKDASAFKKLLEGYPASVRAMLGISIDSVTSLLGFYSMVFGFILLCGAIQAMNLGLSIISKESRERTADFLLVKPVSRRFVMSAKILAAITMLIITYVIFDTASFVIASAVKTSDFDGKKFFMINLTLIFVQLIFLSLGLVISVFFNKLKSVLPISLGVVFGLYILGALIVTKSDDAARFIFPFKYFDTSYIVKNTGYETPYLITSAVIVIVCVAASYVIYSKKDIHAVS